eukprot:Tamp_08018.p1 GENE.Tamp_08018~~Tamp_08018.p1  ORF type:complete len:643 (-),score=136.48 Tamp_08018:467-2137(-)
MVAQRGARQTTTRSARHAELVEDGERLCRAAARGDLEALRKCIVAEGVRVNACDYDRRSALHLAAAEGHASVAEFLVGARADVNARDRWGNTPLRDAERGWHVKVVKLLQQRGAAGSLRGGSHGSLAADESALGEMFCHASAVGDLGMISRLLRKKASVDSCDSDHRSALHLAAAQGKTAVVQYLIKHKADVSARDRFGADPLHDAVRGEHAQVQQLLFEAGARDGVQSLADATAAVADEAYQRQPLQVRARMGRWLVAREEVQLGKPIGEGAQGKVYKADWRGMTVVVKSLKRDSNATDDMLFENEISLMSTLRHPNLVLFLGAVFEESHMMLMAEFLENGSLEDFFEDMAADNNCPLLVPLTVAHKWATELGQALVFLHRCKPPIIHRDVKPGNILISVQGSLKLADFGLSKIKDHEAGRYRMTGITGTVQYMAPEVMRSEDYDESVDVYSYAMVLWYMIHGDVPLMDARTKDIFRAADSGNAMRPGLERITFAPFKDLIKKTWNDDPRARGTADDIVAALRSMRLPRDVTATAARPPDDYSAVAVAEECSSSQ